MITAVFAVFALALGWYAPRRISEWLAKSGIKPVWLVAVWVILVVIGFASSMAAVAILREQPYLHSTLLFPLIATVFVAPFALWRGAKSFRPTVKAS
ncbi:hypothetical protein [Agrobacterium tumefaciens]|uniref:hypothetical protein n=1 Tax=Agrobacterium tumefaciens TaxID=358 RepID=UPI001574F8C4|nr:hypothetical protein [Agrobacterium tumefaciens]NTZ90469.1 hypothetical protein [Agrobacterium tumefaciens]